MEMLVIREGLPKDAHKIAEIEKECFPDPWSEESIFRDIRYNENARYFVASADGETVGYVCCWVIRDEASINNVAVMPEHRGCHIASILMQAMLQETENEGVMSHTLEVRPSNEAAIHLYENMGFLEAGRRPGYYKDNGEDAVIMWRIGDPEDTDPDIRS